MCMYVREGVTIRRADREVECWKVLDESPIGGLTSPCMGVPYYLGQVKNLGKVERLEIKEMRRNMRYLDNRHLYYVREGFHTFASKEDAKVYCCNPRLVLVRCVIPKGTSYVEGVSCDDVPCYVSERLVVGKEVEKCV